MTDYPTDEYGSDGERMQLNPSADFYDDDDDEDDDGLDEEEEGLPEAKRLTAAAGGDGDEEEEDMGYDEDDERYAAAAAERPRTADDKDFMNEEGSGAYAERHRTGGYNNNGYKSKFSDNRFRLAQLEKYNRKQEQQKRLTLTGGGDGATKTVTTTHNRDEVAARESSGNFANDDEDDDNDDDDEDEDDDGIGSEEDDVGGAAGGFFGAQRKTSGGRYFRKNTNDAIKIISTPLGKVGIVYQQTPTQQQAAEEAAAAAASKKAAANTFTDFDALSPDPDSSRRLASSHPKITPVLTPDGKVALLYRGDSESSKYEPIRNLTHKFDNNKPTTTDRRDDNNDDQDDDDDASAPDTAEEEDGVDGDLAAGAGGEQKPGMPHFSPVVPTGGPFIIRHATDSVLPMINRPLSEVLGIKKNQFTQVRVSDGATALPTTASTEPVASPPRTLAGGSQAPQANGGGPDSTTLHFHTNKVNLADYATSARTRNYDFDFSRDNTMLDERTRPKDQQSQTEQNVLANEAMLAKTEVVNLAIIPHFDEELEQRLREHESRRHHRQRHRHGGSKQAQPSEEDLSGIHCIMQAMMGVAAISTVFGMLGTFFKQRILDQLRLLHW